ncbi:unnamed protein product [Calicophoron daubneyi]|uniref:Multidrug and toxin extrusion protein n=1 Tax=Calicophoron daubneyi TaxID=300641 RepID=A0AAV2TF40_CALDB
MENFRKGESTGHSNPAFEIGADDAKAEENCTNSERTDEDINLVAYTDPGRFSKLWKKLFPLGFRFEAKEIISLAIPISVTSIASFLLGPVSVAFCGHLGESQLATIGLATSVFNVFGMYVVMGLVTAGDTIFSQTYGSSLASRMDAQLIKTTVLITLCCVPSCAIYLWSEPLLLLLGQNPLVSKLTARFLMYLIPALILSSWGQVLTSYVQCQDHVYGPLTIMILTNCVNAVLHYVLLFQVHMDVHASAIAQGVAYLFQDICFLIYIQFSRSLVKIHHGFTIEVLENWKGWFQLAVPGVFMLTLEWVLFEIGGLVAGYLGEKELAVQTVMLNIDTLGYTLLPHGVGGAAAIRAGHYLGAKVKTGPQSVLSTTLLLLWLAAPFYFGAYMGLRWYIPRIFTNEPEVIAMTADLMLMLAIFQLLDGTIGLCTGVLRGSGLQYIGAIINTISLYCVGAPLGLCLVFVKHMNLRGLWIGLVVGGGLQVVGFLIACFRIDWKKQVEKVSRRLDEYKTWTVKSLNSEWSGTTSESPTSVGKTETSGPVTDDLSAGTFVRDEYSEARAFNMKYKINLILKRISVFMIMMTLLTVSIICYVLLNWSDYFGFYCVYANGTYIRLNSTRIRENCTVVIP